MKKSKIILVASLALIISVMGIAYDIIDEGRPIPVEMLPQNITAYLSENYPGTSIAYAEKKNKIIDTYYEVSMSNGYEVEFNSNGVVTDFDM